MAEDWITIGNDALTAAINPLGAELSSLRDADGRELMTDADPAFWTGRAPILFPVIGLTQDGIRIDGRRYAIPKHGFARHSLFTLVAHDATQAVFALEDSEATRTVYPYAFRLELTYRLDGATLVTEARIANRGEGPMLASFGFHPAFAWPLPYGQDRADHRIVFAEDEPGKLKAITPNGLIAAEERASPLDGRTLHLADALFTDDALVWSPVHSRSVTYGANTDATPHLHIAFPDTDKLGIWTKPHAAFICIEPWHGIADPEGFMGDFKDKPGVFEVAEGDAKTIAMSIALG
ncbi:aldose 1-epimerase family protein [uncultured Sphingomonas sp.]|uniref:aldose 1-epimerase family protein n=1 Tax=uncultured Sphingomonas sp. TaxID=158754 RepID=UPI00262E955C|nr:aldose 1-epimerase family protein [uncultured Sphingomonas sp.]